MQSTGAPPREARRLRTGYVRLVRCQVLQLRLSAASALNERSLLSNARACPRPLEPCFRRPRAVSR